jgi:hypothetical protein
LPPSPGLRQPKDRRFRQITVTLIVIIVLILLGIFTYFMTRSAQVNLEDKERFIKLSNLGREVTTKLHTTTGTDIKWDKKPSEACFYNPPTMIGNKGGWTCGVELYGTIEANSQSQGKAAILVASSLLRGSKDILQYKNTDSSRDFPNGIASGGSYRVNFTSIKTNIPCTLGFSFPERKFAL